MSKFRVYLKESESFFEHILLPEDHPEYELLLKNGSRMLHEFESEDDDSAFTYFAEWLNDNL